MKTRNSALCALGLAAAITLGGAVTAAAQDTTGTGRAGGRARSQTRIPVRKDQGQPAAAAPARTDTVTVTRTDTVVVRRTDTVTVTRVDTVTRIEELPLQKLGSFQFGLGVGAALPTGDWRNVAHDGFDGHAHLGWFPGAGPVGIRIDGDYVSLSGRETDCTGCPGAKLISGSANLVVRFPLDRKSKVNPQIYFLGGGGIDHFTDFTAYRTTQRPSVLVSAGTKTYTGSGSTITSTSGLEDKSNFYHWDAGGGIQLGRLFIESKYVAINTTNKNSAYVPILIGINF
jgi:hypothetical protein